MTRHLGADAAALVDGELGDAARERALAHLTGCAACREEVEAQRRFKARLRDLGGLGPAPDDGLHGRLLALGSGAWPPERSGSVPLPGLAAQRRAARSRVLVSGLVLAVALGAAAVQLAEPEPPTTRTPVDPRSDVLLVDHAGATGEVVVPVGAGAAGP